MRVAGENLRITINNFTVSYDDYGPVHAPVVIFIHGFPFNKDMWDKQIDELKSNYRVISYDMRGYGGSEDRGVFSLDVLTTDLISLMDALGLRKVSICGMSMGGTVALNAVEKYPHRFNALILSDTFCEPSYLDSREARLAIIDSIKKRGIKQFAEDTVRRFFALGSVPGKEKQIAAARKMILSNPVNSILKTLLQLEQGKETCEQMSNIRVPVLIVAGKEDRVTPPSMAEYMHEHIRGSVFRIIEYAGHLPNLENSEDFNRHLRKFMDRVRLSRILSEPVLSHR